MKSTSQILAAVLSLFLFSSVAQAQYPNTEGLNLTLDEKADVVAELISGLEQAGIPFQDLVLYSPEVLVGRVLRSGPRFEIPNVQAPSIKKYAREAMLLTANGEGRSVICIWTEGESDYACNNGAGILGYILIPARILLAVDDNGKNIFRQKDLVYYAPRRR